jgi:hypothetical protein
MIPSAQTTMFFNRNVLICLILVCSIPGLIGSKTIGSQQGKSEEKGAVTEVKDSPWIPLFNGKDLDGWKVTEVGGQGEAFIENGEVVISQGVDLSGIHTEKPLPKVNYEVEYEAQRAAGTDFFAGLTFPVKDTFCSFILGGWGGGVCGLSNLDGMNASENQTSSYQDFEKGKWYRVRLVVAENKIDVWLDQAHIIDVDTTDQKIDIDFRVEKSKPFGFSTWQTTGRIRNARIRTLPAGNK